MIGSGQLGFQHGFRTAPIPQACLQCGLTILLSRAGGPNFSPGLYPLVGTSWWLMVCGCMNAWKLSLQRGLKPGSSTREQTPAMGEAARRLSEVEAQSFSSGLPESYMIPNPASELSPAEPHTTQRRGVSSIIPQPCPWPSESVIVSCYFTSQNWRWFILLL